LHYEYEKAIDEANPKIRDIAIKVIRLFAEEGLRIGEVYEVIDFLPKQLLAVKLPELKNKN